MSLVFEKAYCPAPLCNPSRTSIMTGLRPDTTKITGNKQWFRDTKIGKDLITIPQYLKQHGYKTVQAGKIFHHGNGKYSDPESWEIQKVIRPAGTSSPPKQEKYTHGLQEHLDPNHYYHRGLDWAPLRQTLEETGDGQVAQYFADLLKQKHNKPFFFACGFFRPHLPWYAPQEYFDMFPIEKINLPPHSDNDLNDIPSFGKKIALNGGFQAIQKKGKWKEAIQAYLACIAFVDECIGIVLDGLIEGPNADNTAIILWSDHGWHLGEKESWGKNKPWERSIRVPLIINIPGVTKPGTRCDRVVNLLDLYPTINQICGLPKKDDLDGRSFMPLLHNHKLSWPYPTITTINKHHSVNDEKYHYIQYLNGENELYDLEKDPNEHYNLSKNKEYFKLIKKFKSYLSEIKK